MPTITIQPLTAEDQDWQTSFITEQWGTTMMVSRGVLYQVDTFPGFVASVQGERIGLVTYRLHGRECEIMSINNTRSGLGVATKLIEAVKEVAKQAGCTRLWLITTNDNTHALRFYQKRGFVLAALHANALEQSRKLKPGIPLLGNDGIPLRDEIELALDLDNE